MSMRRAWGFWGVALLVGAACSSPTRPPTTIDASFDVRVDLGTTVDAAVCELSPQLDLDRDGIATPDGDTGWLDFSRAAGGAQLTTIPNCGGPVYNAAVVKWTAPRAGLLRLRVERDESDWAAEMLITSYLSARRLERCAWDSTTRECSVATYEGDPSHTRSDFEFHVEAGTQWIALAWSFNYGNAGVRATPLPALRISAGMVAGDTSAYGRACDPNNANREALCPARSDCLSVGGAASTCVPRGARGGVCRGPLRDCDDGVLCLPSGNNCEAPAAIGESCERRPCAAGASCVLREPASASTCVAIGTLLGACREAPATPCDGALVCRTVNNQPTCVQETPLGMPCDNSTFCVGTGVCALNAASQLVCAAAGSEGARCGSSVAQPTPCAAGLRCIEQLCRRPRGVGEACDGDRGCEDGLACLSNVCAVPPSGRCTVRGDTCPTGERCSGGMCMTIVATGAACTGGTCAAGYYCAPATQRCEVVLPSLGCVGDTDCARGTVCREHLCVVAGQCPSRDILSTNVVCDTDARCVPSAAGGFVCRPIGRDGGVCRRDLAAPCDAGHRCMGGVCVPVVAGLEGVCSDRLRCAPGTRCDGECKTVGARGTEGGRCRRAINFAGVCDMGLRCDLQTLTCVR